MGLVRLTSSPDPIVTPSGVKMHLRGIGPQDDALIETLIVGAQDWIERETQTQLGAADFLLTLDAWPQSCAMRVPRPPLIAVDSIEYTDVQGQSVPLPSGMFIADATARPGRIVFVSSPPHAACVPNAIRIRFRAGYEDVADVPATLVHAVKMLVGHWYENAEASSPLTIKDVPMAVQSIVLQHAFPEAV